MLDLCLILIGPCLVLDLMFFVRMLIDDLLFSFDFLCVTDRCLIFDWMSRTLRVTCAQ